MAINEHNQSTERDLLLSHSKEMSKQYVVFDGQNRISKVYTAVRRAEAGDPCMVTEYIYTNPTSTVLLARKEAPGTWDATSAGWDALFTI